MVFTKDMPLHYPLPSYVLDISPLFLQYLGYGDLKNVCLSDLVPKHHKISIEKKTRTIQVHTVPGLVNPKLVIHNDSMYLKKANGLFTELWVTLTAFFVSYFIHF